MDKDRISNKGFKLQNFGLRKEIGRNQFSNKMEDECKELSNKFVNAKSSGNLKKRLDRFMDDKWKELGMFRTRTGTCKCGSFLINFLFHYVLMFRGI